MTSSGIQDRQAGPVPFDPSLRNPHFMMNTDGWRDLISAVEAMAGANVPGPVELRVSGSHRFVYENHRGQGFLRVEMDARMFTPQDAR